MVYMLMSFCLCLLIVLALFPKDTIIRKVTDDVVNYELYIKFSTLSYVSFYLSKA